jgi:hypothetical protein
MADVYCDLDLITGANDGTSWTNAWQTMAAMVSGVSAGDNCFIKGTQSHTPGTTTTWSFPQEETNPVRILACKSATFATPPAQLDLIPGWRTGEARTEANRAYNDGDAPSYTITDTSILRSLGAVRWYGFVFSPGGDWQINYSGAGQTLLEECKITLGSARDLQIGQGSVDNQYVTFLNCQYDPAATTCEVEIFNACIFIGLHVSANVTSLLGRCRAFVADFIGCDFTNITGTLINQEGSANFMNCRFNASTTLVTHAITNASRLATNYQSDSTSGKSSGTINAFDFEMNSGTIVEETTAVRTDGASDGSTSWSYAMTPAVNGTRDQYVALIGPWMAFKLSGDGTAKTVTVYIANSGAADYNNDDVWLEVIYPSESGLAMYDYQTTQMELLDTPAAVTDDTDSTWGTGGNNPQKLEASISPDYVGRAYARVCFAKNFSSSPETLYVDPLPVVS